MKELHLCNEVIKCWPAEHQKVVQDYQRLYQNVPGLIKAFASSSEYGMMIFHYLEYGQSESEFLLTADGQLQELNEPLTIVFGDVEVDSKLLNEDIGPIGDFVEIYSRALADTRL